MALSGEGSGCVCIWRLRRDLDEDNAYVLIKILDDPFCPNHHPDEPLDLSGLTDAVEGD